ncbi:MAG: hypothetical protein AB8B73_02800 [Ekhidna sp.]
MKILRIIPFFLLILLSSCYQDSPTILSTPQLIAGVDEFGKTYQVNQITIELGTLRPNDCVTDNFITYFPNGRYEINEGATKCHPNDVPAVTGFWSIDRSESFLTVEIGDSTQIWVIERIENTVHEVTSDFREGLRTYTMLSSN